MLFEKSLKAIFKFVYFDILILRENTFSLKNILVWKKVFIKKIDEKIENQIVL